MSVTRDEKTEQMLPNASSMPFELQGSSNACGTTSLAMVMNYLGIPETRETIDASIRRMDIFSSPEDLLTFARSHGLQAQGYNHGMWSDIERYISLGIPSTLLINADYSYPSGSIDPSNSGLHYVVAAGHGIDSLNGQRYALLHDPEYDRGYMALHEADLIAMGNNISLFSVNWGFFDYYMAFATGTQAPLPSGNSKGIQSALGVVEGVANITNGISIIIHPTSPGGQVSGIIQVIGGAAEAIICVEGALIQKAGQWLGGVVKGIPVISNIVAPIGDLTNGYGAVIGDLGNGLGDVIIDLGGGAGGVIDNIANGIAGAVDGISGALGSLSHGDVGGFLTGAANAAGSIASAAAGAVGNAAAAIGNTINDAGDAAGDAISDAADSLGDAINDLNPF